MKTTDFAELMTEFLTSYLPGFRNVSPNTISSYCDTFRIFLRYCRDIRGMSIEKLSLKMIDNDLIRDFLTWLEQENGNSISTRNQRLMALRAFFRYTQSGAPYNLLECQKVLDIPAKKDYRPVISYLTKEETKALLSQPDTSNSKGRRDLVLLSVMYDTGARVQEIADLTARDVRVAHPPHVRLTGKGRKAREVPLLERTTHLLRRYMEEHRFHLPENSSLPLFPNRKGLKMTRFGFTYILKKYAEQAAKVCPTFPPDISPHVLRHTKAMHLLQADVNIIYIRDILGHVDVKTTQIYANADMKMKRQALEKLGGSPSPDVPSWVTNTDLLSWLKDFGSNVVNLVSKKP